MNRLPLYLLLAALAAAPGAFAETAGPAQPDKPRQHPLDNREPHEPPAEPRQGQPLERPPTLQPRQAPIESDVPPHLESPDPQPGTDVDAAGPRVLRS